jgi:hypothetical protein
VNLAGTETGAPTYYAWFEFYPHPAYLIGNYVNGVCNSDCVSPGDIIFAEVKVGGGGVKGQKGKQFAVTITNETQNWSFSTSSAANGAKQSSAEWIAETPFGCSTKGGFCDLSDFDIAYYGEKYAPIHNTVTESATVGGQTGTLGSFGNAVQEAICPIFELKT